MNGLTMSKQFYLEYGKPMIEMEYKLYLNSMAFGLVGQGSECFAYDDMISRDHDFAPGFCICAIDSIICNRCRIICDRLSSFQTTIERSN